VIKYCNFIRDEKNIGIDSLCCQYAYFQGRYKANQYF